MQEKYFEEKGIDGIIDGVLVEEFVEVLNDVAFGIHPIPRSYAY